MSEALQEVIQGLSSHYSDFVINDSEVKRKVRTTGPALREIAISHLFIKYQVQPHVRWLIDSDDNDLREVFFAAAQGRSVFKTTILKACLTKHEVHRALTCPYHAEFGRQKRQRWGNREQLNDKPFFNAMAWAKMITFGSDPRLAMEIVSYCSAIRGMFNTWLDVRDVEVIAFLSRVCKSFDEKDKRRMSGIFDFLHANPDLPLNGRTKRSIAKASARWHTEVAVRRDISYKLGKAVIVPLGLPFKSTQGYNFVELTTAAQLADEGAVQRHCVSSYAWRLTGDRGIVSMRELKSGKRVLTIEVFQGQVVQVRGFANRSPTVKEKAAVKTWANSLALGYI